MRRILKQAMLVLAAAVLMMLFCKADPRSCYTGKPVYSPAASVAGCLAGAWLLVQSVMLLLQKNQEQPGAVQVQNFLLFHNVKIHLL